MIRAAQGTTAEVARIISEEALAVGGSYYQLVLLVSTDDASRASLLSELHTRYGAAVVNVGEHLALSLLETPSTSRASAAYAALESLVAGRSETLVVADHIELLFEPSLRLDPVQALARLSRNRVVIAVWPGLLDGETLTYAESGHPEFYEHAVKDFLVLVANPPTHLFPDGPHGRG